MFPLILLLNFFSSSHSETNHDHCYKQCFVCFDICHLIIIALKQIEVIRPNFNNVDARNMDFFD